MRFLAFLGILDFLKLQDVNAPVESVSLTPDISFCEFSNSEQFSPTHVENCVLAYEKKQDIASPILPHKRIRVNYI